MASGAHLNLGILEGDDIGHEIVPAAVAVVARRRRRPGSGSTGRPLPIGRTALDTHGHTMPKETMDTLPTLDGWILGPIGHRDYPKVPAAINPHPILRKSFDLFANVRPTKSYPGLGCLYDDIDLVIVRENNEGFQPDRNCRRRLRRVPPDRGRDDLRPRHLARGQPQGRRGGASRSPQRRKHLTLVHKNTVFKLGCGMFVEECYKAAAAYPDVKVDEVIVDTFAMRLVRDPQTFDMVVTTNMFGDILTDEAAGLVGGLGMAPGLCIGDGDIAMAQATHGSAPDIAGKGIANPFAMIESTRMLVEWLGMRRGVPEAAKASAMIKRGIEAALADPKTRTGDIRGTGGTADMVRGIVANLGE